eukprot:245892_1
MSLFRRCQRFQPLIANAYKSQFASASLIGQTRNGGGGHGFPRAAFDRSVDVAPEKFPKNGYLEYSNEPQNFPLFMRSKGLDTATKPPKEAAYMFCFLMVSWGYGLWYNSKYNKNHH